MQAKKKMWWELLTKKQYKENWNFLFFLFKRGYLNTLMDERLLTVVFFHRNLLLFCLTSCLFVFVSLAGNTQ